MKTVVKLQTEDIRKIIAEKFGVYSNAVDLVVSGDMFGMQIVNAEVAIGYDPFAKKGDNAE